MTITSNIANLASSLVTGTTIDNLNADFLDGQSGSFYTGYTDSANTQLKAYTDGLVSSSVSSANTQLKAYTDGLVSSANTQLKSYTDGLVSSSVSSANTQLKSYVDGNFFLKTGGTISGNVGIGTSSPQRRLQSTITATNAAGRNAATGLLITNSDFSGTFGAPNRGVIQWAYDPNSPSAYIEAGTYGNGYLAFSSDGTNERLRIDASGNLGLGVTPSAWRSVTKVLQINNAAFRVDTDASSFVNNAFINSSNQNIYINNGFATSYAQTSGQHLWFTATSGTAGNPITFSQDMTLTSKGLLVGYTSDASLSSTGNAIFSGSVGIGTSSPLRKLDINGGGMAFTELGGAARNIHWGNTDNVYPVTIHGNATSGACFLAFNTNTFGNGAVERMRLDSSGNLGLGVTPSAWNTISKAFQFGSTAAFENYNNVSNNSFLNVYRDSSNQFVYLTSAAASLYGQYQGSHSWYTAPSGTAGNPITFNQAMTLDASGNLGIGTTSPVTNSVTLNSKLLFIFYIQSTYPNIAARIGHAGDSGGVTFINFNNSVDRGFTWFNGTTIGGAVTQVMRLDNSGNLTISGATATKASGTTWANPSDTRLKDNQQLYTKGLDDLLKIVVKTWEFNGKGGSTKGAKGLGVIADEIERVLPESVDTYSAKLNDEDENETEIKRFDASEVIWLLVKSVQELAAEIELLKSKLN